MSSNLQLSLSFSNGHVEKPYGEPYFLSDNGIKGHIVIHNAKPPSYDLVKISLEGFLMNTIQYADWPKTQQKDTRKLQVLLRMSDIKKRSDFSVDSSTRHSRSKCSFRFQIPQCLGNNLLGEDSEFLSDLPASMTFSEVPKDGTTAQRFCFGEGRIHYAIRVDVIRHETAIASLMKPVQILPSLQSRPPVCPSDFGHEYTTSTTKPLRGKGRLSLGKVGHCSIEATQPSSVVLRHIKDPFTVTVPLRISLHASSPTTRDQNQLKQQFEAALKDGIDCTTSLISSTYISVIPRRTIPTQTEAEKTNNLTKTVSLCSKSTSRLTRVSDWTYSPETESWECKASATFTFDKFRIKGPVVPSFDSSMISHRYRLGLKVELNLSSKATFALDVPIMIRYSGCDGGSARRPSHLPQPEFERLASISEDVEDEGSLSSSSSGPGTPFEEEEEGITRQMTTLEIQDLLREHQFRAPLMAELQLPAYCPRGDVGEAPPYVV